MADTKLENMTATTTPALTDLAYLVVPGAPSVDRKITLANLHKILGGVTDITYANLVSAIGGATLTPGTLYRITDYATVHYIVDGDGTWYSDIITGTTEPLIVMATSTSTINKQAYSPAHPEDVIYYDWNPANWMDDLSFVDDPEGTPPVIVTGFKGVITFRHDTLLDNYAGFDFRECKFRRWKTNATAWNSGTAYVAGQFVLLSSKIYVSIKAGTNKDPATQTGYWFPIINLTYNEYWNAAPGTWLDIPSNDAVYDDFKLFAEGTGTATYELCCRANHFEPFKDDNSDYDANGSLLPNNVFILSDDSYYTCYDNEFGAETYGNTFDSSTYNNKFGSYFYNNNFGVTVKNNVFGKITNDNVVYSTFLSNIIGPTFRGNYISSFFKNNIINGEFGYNYVGDDFESNVINVSFASCLTKNIFIKNIIDAEQASVDFTSATKVYGDYNCRIFKRSDGTFRLSYIDGSDVVQYTAPTA